MDDIRTRARRIVDLLTTEERRALLAAVWLIHSQPPAPAKRVLYSPSDQAVAELREIAKLDLVRAVVKEIEGREEGDREVG
jgi:hypothetical protein